MSPGCGEFVLVGDGLKMKRSPLFTDLGFCAAGRNERDFRSLLVDRKITRRLENQLFEWLETDQVFDAFLDLDGIRRNFNLGCDLSGCFADTVPTICHENGIRRQTAKMKLGWRIWIGHYR